MTREDAQGLKPCPFCGGTAKEHGSLNEKWMHCTTCGADGPVRHQRAEAIAAWNRRAE